MILNRSLAAASSSCRASSALIASRASFGRWPAASVKQGQADQQADLEKREAVHRTFLTQFSTGQSGQRKRGHPAVCRAALFKCFRRSEKNYFFSSVFAASVVAAAASLVAAAASLVAPAASVVAAAASLARRSAKLVLQQRHQPEQLSCFSSRCFSGRVSGCSFFEPEHAARSERSGENERNSNLLHGETPSKTYISYRTSTLHRAQHCLRIESL